MSGNVRIGLLLLLIWSISVYLCNVAIDVVLAILYYQTGDCVDSLFTFVLILFPTILTSLLSYAYHEKIIFNPNTPSKITEVTGLLKKPVKDVGDRTTRKSSSKSFVFRLICNIFLFPFCGKCFLAIFRLSSTSFIHYKQRIGTVIPFGRALRKGESFAE